jgi:voltage-gated potassium channel
VAKKEYKLTKIEERVEEWFEMPMVLVTLLLVFTLLIPILFDLPRAWQIFFATANLIIWFAFYIELVVKVYIAKNKVAALKRNWSLILIAIAPLFTSLRLMRISRLTRLSRFVGLTRFVRLQNYVKKTKKHTRDLVYNIEQILLILGVFVVISGFIMWQIELRFDGSISTFPDALWWSVITLTTIGYGDIIPTSPEGRVVGSIIGLLGAILFMVFVAKITTMFVRKNA